MNKKWSIFLFILGLLGLIYSEIARSKNVSFSSFFLVIGLILIAIGLLIIFVKGSFWKGKIRIVIKVIKVFLVIFLVSFIWLELIILNSSKETDDHIPRNSKFDYIIVLGAGVDGTKPSPIMESRLESALKLIDDHQEAKVILSGGQGSGEMVTEAEAMSSYLISHGVEEKRIIKEERSTSTFENLANSQEILNKIFLDKKVEGIIVTSDFHLFRAEFLAKRLGLDVIGDSAPSLLWLRPQSYFREYFGVIKSYLMDRK